MSQDMSQENLPDRPAHQGGGQLATAENPFADPGFPAHLPRRQDIDEKAARSSERTVAFLFTVSMLATLAFIASFVVIPIDKIVYIWPLGHISALNFALGMTLGVSLFAIGAGAVHWARTLMSDVEVADDRHPIEASPEVSAKVKADFATGAGRARSAAAS